MHGTRQSVTSVGKKAWKKLGAPDVKIFRHMFLNSNKDIIRAFDRLHTKVDVMLGMELMLLHFSDGYKVENIRLKRSVLAPRGVLRVKPQCKEFGTANTCGLK